MCHEWILRNTSFFESYTRLRQVGLSNVEALRLYISTSDNRMWRNYRNMASELTDRPWNECAWSRLALLHYQLHQLHVNRMQEPVIPSKKPWHDRPLCPEYKPTTQGFVFAPTFMVCIYLKTWGSFMMKSEEQQILEILLTLQLEKC
jgi:hypothetical protein